MSLGERNKQNRMRFRRQILWYSVIALVFLVLQCLLMTYWGLKKYDHTNVTEHEAKQYVHMVRSKLPARFHRLNSLKIILHKSQPNSTRYVAIVYGLYAMPSTEIDVNVELSYQESIEQGIAFTCKGEIWSKAFSK